jgi:hypothetical protein
MIFRSERCEITTCMPDEAIEYRGWQPLSEEKTGLGFERIHVNLEGLRGASSREQGLTIHANQCQDGLACMF